MAQNQRTILVTGATGQDGSNMADFLLKETDYEIYGGVRRLSVPNHKNLSKAIGNPRFHLIDFDLADSVSIHAAVEKIKPSFILNFAAQSFVGVSWNMPEQTFSVNALGVMRILETVRKIVPNCRVYSAGSSEEFGKIEYSPQNENHPLRPQSPYGCSKTSANHICRVWRQSYKTFVVHAHLFNHEGIRRGEEFITRKITKNLARIKKELSNRQTPTPMNIGNIHAKRDWSDSEDFVVGIWLMMQQDTPEDFVLSSDETHSVKEFIDLACKYVGFENTEWVIDDVNVENTQLSILQEDGTKIPIVKVSKEYFRPAEVDILLGDSTKARTQLGWKPKTTFEGLVKKMMLYDLNND